MLYHLAAEQRTDYTGLPNEIVWKLMSIPRKMRLATVFTTVADEGGFRAAGRKLGLSPAQVSQGVTDLEAVLGTALLYRSTRKLQLTKAAEAILPHFRDMVESFERGIYLLDKSHPSEIRVSLPSALVTSFFAKVMMDWQAQNNKTRLVLEVRDDHQIRAGTNADLFIRIGGPEQDMRIARLLCEVTGYLAMVSDAFPRAHTADDLRNLPLAVPFAMQRGFPWTHKESGEVVKLGSDASITVNNTQLLNGLLLTGRVVAPVFDFERRPPINDAELVNAAPDWQASSLTVRAIYASDRPTLSPARDLVEFLSEMLPVDLRKRQDQS